MTNFTMATGPVRMISTAVAALTTTAVLAACGAADGDAVPASGRAGAGQQAAESTRATPSEVLASTAWETTGAVDQDGRDVPLEDEKVATFVGWAYFEADGTFAMYNLDDSPKMQGDWTVSADGTTRHIVAEDDAGEVLFERDSDIVMLTEDEFTYRVFPDENDTSIYVDIVHTPTDHAEPAAA